jgi:hypothetical protein
MTTPLECKPRKNFIAVSTSCSDFKAFLEKKITGDKLA